MNESSDTSIESDDDRTRYPGQRRGSSARFKEVPDESDVYTCASTDDESVSSSPENLVRLRSRPRLKNERISNQSGDVVKLPEVDTK